MDYNGLFLALAQPRCRAVDPVEVVNPSLPVYGSRYPFPRSRRRLQRLFYRDLISHSVLARFLAELLIVLAGEHSQLPAIAAEEPDLQTSPVSEPEVTSLALLDPPVPRSPFPTSLAAVMVLDEVHHAPARTASAMFATLFESVLDMADVVGREQEAVPFPGVPEQAILFRHFDAVEFAYNALCVARMDPCEATFSGTSPSRPWNRFLTLLLTLNTSTRQLGDIEIYTAMTRAATALQATLVPVINELQLRRDAYWAASLLPQLDARDGGCRTARWWNSCRKAIPVVDWRWAEALAH